MLRTPTSQSALCKHALSCFFALCLPFLAKADLGVTFQMNQDGSQVTADVLVYNFTDILSMQFGMKWDPAELEFVSVSDINLPGMDQTYFGVNQLNDGILLSLWYDQSANGYSIPDCSSIFRITFNTINGQVPPIIIDSAVMIIEVYNAQMQEIDLTQNLGCGALGKASGKLFRDDNDNCTNDDGDLDLEGWQVKFVVDKLPYFATTNANGNYNIVCPAGYCEATVLFSEDGHIWEACQLVTGFQLAENQEVDLSFGTHDLGPTSNTSGVFDFDKNGFSVKIAPNPVRSNQPIFIETSSEMARQISLQIYDTNGRLLHNWQQAVAAGTVQFTAPASLTAGLYLLKIADENGVGKAVKLAVY